MLEVRVTEYQANGANEAPGLCLGVRRSTSTNCPTNRFSGPAAADRDVRRTTVQDKPREGERR
jgi:hypothetical protein